MREAVRSCPSLRPRDRRSERLFYFLIAFGSGELSVSSPFATYRECRNAVEALASLHRREAPDLEIGFSACYPCPPDKHEEEE